MGLNLKDTFLIIRNSLPSTLYPICLSVDVPIACLVSSQSQYMAHLVPLHELQRPASVFLIICHINVELKLKC